MNTRSDMLKFLIFGDVVGKTGRRAIAKILPRLKKQYRPDLVIANAENIAHGLGTTPKTLRDLQLAGVDFFTGGNHSFDKPEAKKILEENDSPLLRPANMLNQPGQGAKLLNLATKRVLVINLIGRVFIEKGQVGEDIKLSNPFTVVEEILKIYQEEKIHAILVDFHSEATSEQIAMGYFLDGRVSAVVGTHTHVPTADATILPGGTAYITDIGMTGAIGTVLGVSKEIILDRFVNESERPIDCPETDTAMVSALYLEVDPKTAQTKKIKLIQKEIKI